MKKIIPTLALSIALSACGTLDYFSDKPDNKIEGDRLSINDFEKSLQSGSSTKFGMDKGESDTNTITLSNIAGGTDTAITLDAPWTNKFWPQIGGYPNHAMKHIAFNNREPKSIWSESIGAGGTKRMPLTSAPIMADGTIFTLNNDAEIVAFDANNGDELWDHDIIKTGEDEVVIGGGLAFSGGQLFATNGFNEVIALNPKNGNILWRTDTKAPIRAAPSAMPGRVIISTMNNETIALNSKTGERLWSHRGLSSEAGLLGSSTPALTRDAVITAYSSGEIYALQIDTGLELWSVNLSPLTRISGQSSITDIRALPVVEKGIVYAASSKNRMHAIDIRTGQTTWQTALGTNTTPWISGNRLFVIDARGTLVSIDKDSGNGLWQTDLDQFDDDDRIQWTGPILANNRLIVIGSHGEAHDYNPQDGSFIRSWDIDKNVMLAPALANETLYLLSDSGRLRAYR